MRRRVVQGVGKLWLASPAPLDDACRDCRLTSIYINRMTGAAEPNRRSRSGRRWKGVAAWLSPALPNSP
jgi:hypothetical protein